MATVLFVTSEYSAVPQYPLSPPQHPAVMTSYGGRAEAVYDVIPQPLAAIVIDAWQFASGRGLVRRELGAIR